VFKGNHKVNDTNHSDTNDSKSQGDYTSKSFVSFSNAIYK
jgi:hypothetical protein